MANGTVLAPGGHAHHTGRSGVRAKAPRPGPRRAARALPIAVARLSGGPRMLPDFLIVGAQRSGTTSLSRALSAHPAVLTRPLQGEVHFFDKGYDRGLRWYRAHFPSLARAEHTSRDTGTGAQAFESSPYYMFHPWAPARIGRDLPVVRLVVLLRDPVERACSAHAHERAKGHETLAFEEALELEGFRLAGELERMLVDPGYYSYSHQHHGYRARGLYAEQLTALARHVPADRIHVVDSGRMFAQPERVLERLLAFLGLPPHPLVRLGRHNARPRQDMPESLRARLRDYYQPFDEQLVPWLGAAPSWRS